MLRRVDIKDIDIKNTHFYLTELDKLESIEKNNLKAKEIKNTFNESDKPRIYFASGTSNLLKNQDVWLKWKMNELYGISSLEKRYSGRELEDYKHLWIQEVLSKEYKNDTKKKTKLFQNYYYDLIDSIYLVLDISNGKEYDNLDYDLVKLKLLQDKDSLEYKFMKEIYGSFSNMDSAIMEPWNRHTLKYAKVKARDIRIVSENDKTINAVEVLRYFYDNYKDTDYDLLDDFFTWLTSNEL